MNLAMPGAPHGLPAAIASFPHGVLRVRAEEGGAILLPLSPRILIESTRLPGTIHKDPFDRMLVATAREHDLSLVSKDEPVYEYSVGGHVRVRRTEIDYW